MYKFERRYNVASAAQLKAQKEQREKDRRALARKPTPANLRAAAIDAERRAFADGIKAAMVARDLARAADGVALQSAAA